ncbi:unnamed protein product [Dibothriocephalus latus]|uniref:Uncharacterized protein n=1 Tax=Dibothriocephalus latus TaxID=60516 RepID=A0A3P7M6B2_DIBLA|nr:unnamed protein product [Dibothriocephalus latus]
MRELYRAISDLPGVSLNGQRVWLDAMADWLETVQAAFDRDRNLGHISSTGFWTANASALGVLGLRLIVQTNHGLQLDRIITARLVTNRIVDPTGFNIFLRVWRNHDILNYTGPPCVIFPDPGLGHDLRLFTPTAVGGGPHDLSPIRPAVPTEYVQTSFFASGYATVESQIELVKVVFTKIKFSLLLSAPKNHLETSYPIFDTPQHSQYLLLHCLTATGLVG